LGDVSGKGTAAALLAALTIGILRAHSVDHPCAPEQLLATLNERLNAARLNALFVAMVFAVFDSNARQITIANAGSPYPLLVRKGRIEEIPLTGIPLGLMPDTKYERCPSISIAAMRLSSFQTASSNAKVANTKRSAPSVSRRS